MATETKTADVGQMIYIASKTKHADRWRTIASVHPVSSTWIYEAGEGETSDYDDLWNRCLTEAANSKALVLYREADDVLKGGWIELGAALANGIPVHAVGIEEFTVAKYGKITHHRTMKDAVTAALKEPARRPSISEGVKTEAVEKLTDHLRYIGAVLAAHISKFTVPDHIPAKIRHLQDAAASLTALSAELEQVKKEKQNLQAALTARAKTLLRLRDAICTVHDHIEDEGDRVYFGSTNHADELKAVWQELDGWAWDGILADGELPDIYAACRKANARATAAEAREALLREALTRLRKSAVLLQQNAEGCAVNHYGEDFGLYGMPGWLRDTAADIEAARSAITEGDQS